MSAETRELPRARADLVIRNTGKGEYVVKLPTNGTYFRIGDAEHFLLSQLDGQQSADSVRHAFKQRFGERLSPRELNEFVETVRPLGLLDQPDGSETTAISQGTSSDDEDDEVGTHGRGNILFFRRRLFDPDWLLSALEPHLRWIWTRTFVVVTLMAMLAALLTMWDSRQELIWKFPQAMRWEVIVLAWMTLIITTMLHEFAHGLTCKHFGGEVREIGVLVALLTPCFYCNVSDAWLISKKSRRLWVTLAGGYCDLCQWSLAVFVWRLTVQDSLVNYVAWLVLSICGGRILFNLNPLLKMDGYYLLSDALEIPNLRRRAADYWMEHVRWLLWGASRPQPQVRGGALLLYGLSSWLFALTFLDFVVLGLFHYLGNRWGWPGLILTLLLLSVLTRRVSRGFFKSEFAIMITTRPQRTAVWMLGALSVLSFLFFVKLPYVTNGNFEVRPGTRTEIHAPIAGFMKTVHHGEGATVSPDTVIVELDVPDLASSMVRKRAEIRECEASLRRLKVGPRPEEVAEQQARVSRAEGWRDLALQDRDRAKISLQQDLFRLDQQVLQTETELKYAHYSLTQAAKLYQVGALAGEQYRSEYKRYELSNSQHAQAKALKLSREAEGLRQAESEVARREKELADARAALSLLQAGSRQEDIEGEVAKLARLQEELKFLEEQRGKQKICSGVTGVIATPRMPERIGQLAEKGALICVVEDVAVLQAEIAIPEEDVVGLAPTQAIDLKARALPFDTFTAKVDRIAPAAFGAPNQLRSTVTVYCHVANTDGKLKSGMTGVARIYRGHRPLGWIMLTKALGYVRTEFWW